MTKTTKRKPLPAFIQAQIDKNRAEQQATWEEDFPLVVEGVTATKAERRRFQQMYDYLAKVGLCDCFGGAESSRVWGDWVGWAGRLVWPASSWSWPAT